MHGISHELVWTEVLKLNFPLIKPLPFEGVFVLFTSWVHWIQCSKLFWTTGICPDDPFLILQIFHLYSVVWLGKNHLVLKHKHVCSGKACEVFAWKKCLIFQALASPKKNWNFPAWKFIRVLAHLELLGPESCMVYFCDWCSSCHKLSAKTMVYVCHWCSSYHKIISCKTFFHPDMFDRCMKRFHSQITNEVSWGHEFSASLQHGKSSWRTFRSSKVGIRFLDLHWKSHQVLLFP